MRNYSLQIPTSDLIIRNALIKRIAIDHPNRNETLIIPELGLNQGETRVDVAVVNGIIHGYEIKSDLDTFIRLPDQMRVYNTIFDKVTLVVGKSHLVASIYQIPEWWGIVLAKIDTYNRVNLLNIREPENNPSQDTLAFTDLLWKEEMIQILSQKNLLRGYKTKSKKVISERLINLLNTEDLKNIVRENFKQRVIVKGWRPDLLSM